VLGNELQKVIGITGCISNQSLKVEIDNQRLGLSDNLPLVGNRVKRNVLPSPSTLMWILVLKPPRMRPILYTRLLRMVFHCH